MIQVDFLFTLFGSKPMIILCVKKLLSDIEMLTMFFL